MFENPNAANNLLLWLVIKSKNKNKKGPNLTEKQTFNFQSI